MKKILHTLFISLPVIVNAQTTVIPDPAFEQALIDLGYDDFIDGVVTTSNIVDVQFLDVSMKNIEDLTGIEDFDSLSALDCHDNQLTSLDVSANTALTYLYCQSNQLTSLDVSQFENLVNLRCYNNQITSLDVSQNEWLQFLSCTNNELDTLIMPEASQNFRELEASNNNLTHLEMTNYALAAWIIAENNQLNSVDLSGSTVEVAISFSNNLITEINLDGSDLSYLIIENNQLSFIDLSQQSNLQWFSATENPGLDCIKVSQEQLENIPSDPNTGLWTVDATTIYALECSTANLNESNATSFNLFPNPTKDILNIRGIDTIKNYTIYDHTGKALFNGTTEIGAQINIWNLQQGLYLCSIEGSGVRRFIKN